MRRFSRIPLNFALSACAAVHPSAVSATAVSAATTATACSTQSGYARTGTSSANRKSCEQTPAVASAAVPTAAGSSPANGIEQRPRRRRGSPKKVLSSVATSNTSVPRSASATAATSSGTARASTAGASVSTPAPTPSAAVYGGPRRRLRRPHRGRKDLLLEALADIDAAAGSISDVSSGTGSSNANGGTQAGTAAVTAADESDAFTHDAESRPGRDGAAQTASLLGRLSARNFVARLQEHIAAAAAPISQWWSRTPSSAALHYLERQLELAVRRDSLDMYVALHATVRARFEDPLVRQKADSSSGLLLIYSWLLVNYGTHCLLNSDVPRAATLLQEAVSVGQRASEAEGGAHGATCVLYARVLLANALSCECLYWQAVEQYVEVMRTLEDNPYDVPTDTSTAAASSPSPPSSTTSAVEQESEAATATLAQIAPGTKPFAMLCRQLIAEDFAVFLRDADIVERAASQARAHELLLRSQGAPPQVLSQLRLTLARMYRHASEQSTTSVSHTKSSAGGNQQHRFQARNAALAQSRAQASRELYEEYLDDLVAREEEDRQYAMLELGRMLIAAPAVGSMNDEDVAQQLEAGVVYLETASELLLEEAEATLDSRTEAGTLTAAQLQIVVRAAGALVDTAQAHHMIGNDAAALGLFEGSIELLRRGGLTSISAWVLCRYADVLSSVSFVDKAITLYGAAMEVLRANERSIASGGSSAAAVPSHAPDAEAFLGGTTASGAAAVSRVALPLQLGPRQRMVPLSRADAEASLAYCYQMYVGDHRRALRHYNQVMLALTGARDTDSSDDKSAKEAGRGVRPTLPPPGSILTLEREHFIMANMRACAERLEDWESAIGAQSRIIAVETALSSHAVDACLRLVALMENVGQYAKMLGVLFYLLQLPDTEIDSVSRVVATHRFATCCYRLGNRKMGSTLLRAVRGIEADHNPQAVLNWALAAARVEDTGDRLYAYVAADLKVGVSTVANTFLRAAHILSAQHACAAADAAAAAASSEANGTSALQRPPVDLEAWHSSLVTLSRGAFFFHQNGFPRHAEELYSAAVELADSTHATMAAAASTPSSPSSTFPTYRRLSPSERAELLTDCSRELAIVLANYATLTFTTDPARAAELYDRAATIESAPLEVAEVVADYLVQTGNYAKGVAHMKWVIAAHPDAAARMHTRVARLGCGNIFDSLPASERLGVLEHAILGLGVDAARLPSHGADAPTTDANLAVRVAALDELALDGVCTTASDEAACLTCFVLQTKFAHKARLVNSLYRVALRRFPFHTAILVNYAKLCGDFGFHTLTRKLYARAYGAADGDFSRTLCYVNYLSSAHGDEQTPTGEALYRHHVEANPQSSQAHMFYANFLAMMMPTPFVTEKHFSRGVELDPRSPHIGLYAQCVWAAAMTPVAQRDAAAHKAQYDRAEGLFMTAAANEPTNPRALLNLGTFYANRVERFEDAVQALYKAYTLAPTNVEVLRQLCTTLLEECLRVQHEVQQRNHAPAAPAAAATATRSDSPLAALGPMAPRLRALIESTQQIFDKCLEFGAANRDIMEKYADFAVRVLKNPKLAADLWIRINRLPSKE